MKTISIHSVASLRVYVCVREGESCMSKSKELHKIVKENKNQHMAIFLQPKPVGVSPVPLSSRFRSVGRWQIPFLTS